MGIANFRVLLQDSYKVLANTVLINIYHIVIGFTFVIFLSLMLNDSKVRWFKRMGANGGLPPPLRLLGGHGRYL